MYKIFRKKKLINKVIRTKKINDKKVNDTNVYTVNNLKKYIVEDNSEETKKIKRWCQRNTRVVSQID